MNTNVFYVSDCCGRDIGDDAAQYGVCTKCGEHCEVIKEVYHDDEMDVSVQKNLFGNESHLYY